MGKREPLEGGPADAEVAEGELIAAAFEQEYGHTLSRSPSFSLPERIGPYKILRLIGEGGMGIVCEAEQIEPIKRRVALKLIKAGMDTEQVIARFESERQALAMINHPNVARVLDAGSTEEGRPYYVMEYVPGTRITHYCDRHKLTTQERLRLFGPVCDAIQHAHEKGIIHRDIKPSNVLVMILDGKPTPKVIDFGVAKATDRRLTERTVFTEYGQLIGTPEYMSPEQAEMTNLDVDTRTDIYSLGVLLYELLAGVLPFDSRSLRAAGYAEIQRIIRQVEPSRPSARLSTLGEKSTTLSERRQTDTRTLVRQLRGDLDWITMMAMEKDRTRRYATASDLADDIARYLRNEPVKAGPPGLSYRAKKFVGRRKGFVVGAVVALVVSGLALATIGRLFADRDRLRNQRIRADAGKLSAETTSWLNRAIHYTEQEHWAEAETAFRKALANDPESVDVRLDYTRMKVHRFFAHARDAEETRFFLADVQQEYERVLERAPEAASGWNRLGILLKKLGRYEEAIDVYHRACEVDPDYFAAWTNLATAHALLGNFEIAKRDFQKAAELAERDTDVAKVPYAVDAPRNLASLQHLLGEPDARANIERAIRINSNDPASRLIYARVLLASPQPEDFEGALYECTRADEDFGGKYAKAKRILALAHLRRDRLEEAIEYAEAAIALSDLPAFSHLIIATANARLSNLETARSHLELASNNWPRELQSTDGYIATAERGVLWFDTAEELNQLRRIAQEAMAAELP